MPLSRRRLILIPHPHPHSHRHPVAIATARLPATSTQPADSHLRDGVSARCSQLRPPDAVFANSPGVIHLFIHCFMRFRSGAASLAGASVQGGRNCRVDRVGWPAGVVRRLGEAGRAEAAPQEAGGGCCC
jgi:hypothetical protein